MTKEQLGTLILNSERQLYSTAKTILFNDQDCADAIQETIVKAFSKIETLRNDKYAKTWLIRILINECYTLLRKSSKLVSLETMSEMTEIEADKKADYSDLYKAVNSLKEELRLPVILYYIEDFNIKEIAQILEITEGAVQKRLARARGKLIELQELLSKISGKFKRTATGKINKRGAMKSLLSKQNLYNVPNELECYKGFFENKDINIPWIDWKNKGDSFDVEDRCPYCSEKVNRTEHDKRKDIFQKNYSKTDSQNLKEILELLESLEAYIKPTKYMTLVSYVKNDTPEDIIENIMNSLLGEFDLILSRFIAIEEFGNRKIVINDISELDKQISAMEFPKQLFDIFGGEKIEGVFDRINSKVEKLQTEVTVLKKEMGALKGIMQATIVKSQTDINEFLKTAGINYELVIQTEDESNSRTILKQCFTEEKTDAFSLILFMYYANLQNPDLIILDDPISSFDTNKKYAILQRMFKNIGNKNVTLADKTVLLLTHDFEPIIDFIVVGKLDESKAVSSFVCNVEGNVVEKDINPEEDVKLILRECKDIAADESVNVVSRIAFLRKLCELYECRENWGDAYEILSCLVHAKPIKRKIANNVYEDMSPEEIDAGVGKIKEFIPDFSYDDMLENTYTIDHIKELYHLETNAYLKIQLFRALKDIVDEKQLSLKPMDGAWYKFIDETYHIENDYLHYLDVMKFNIVPDYIMKKVDEIMSGL